MDFHPAARALIKKWPIVVKFSGMRYLARDFKVQRALAIFFQPQISFFMKSMKIFTLLSFVAVMFFAAPMAQAAVALESAAVEVIEADQQLSKKDLKTQKRLERMQKKMTKKGMDVDFSDPVQKWLWFAIFGWGIGIVLTILASVLFTATLGGGWGAAAILWLVAYLAYLFGSISFIIWLVKLLS
jgi:hypothetical protein